MGQFCYSCKNMYMSIIRRTVTVYPVFCVGLYFSECVYVLSCFIVAYCFLLLYAFCLNVLYAVCFGCLME